MKPPADCHPEREHYAKGLCVTCYSAARRARDPEATRTYSREWQREQRRLHPVRHRRREQASNHRLSLADLEAMYDAQDSKCAACGVVSDRLQIDHDHTTGAIRGLLCGRCNSTAGQADDSVDRLMAVAAYLMQFHDVLLAGFEEVPNGASHDRI